MSDERIHYAVRPPPCDDGTSRANRMMKESRTQGGIGSGVLLVMSAIFATFTFCWLLVGLLFPFLAVLGLMCFLGAFGFLIAALSGMLGRHRPLLSLVSQVDRGDAPYHRPVELYFDDRASLDRAVQSRAGRSALEQARIIATGGLDLMVAELVAISDLR